MHQLGRRVDQCLHDRARRSKRGHRFHRAQQPGGAQSGEAGEADAQHGQKPKQRDDRDEPVDPVPPFAQVRARMLPQAEQQKLQQHLGDIDGRENDVEHAQRGVGPGVVCVLARSGERVSKGHAEQVDADGHVDEPVEPRLQEERASRQPRRVGRREDAKRRVLHVRLVDLHVFRLEVCRRHQLSLLTKRLGSSLLLQPQLLLRFRTTIRNRTPSPRTGTLC